MTDLADTLASAQRRARDLTEKRRAVLSELEAVQMGLRQIMQMRDLDEVCAAMHTYGDAEMSVPERETEAAVLAGSDACRELVPAVFTTVPESHEGVVRAGEVVLCLKNELEYFVRRGWARPATAEEVDDPAAAYQGALWASLRKLNLGLACANRANS